MQHVHFRQIQNGLAVLNPGIIVDQASGTYLTYRIHVDSVTQPHLAQWVFVDARIQAQPLAPSIFGESEHEREKQLQAEDAVWAGARQPDDGIAGGVLPSGTPDTLCDRHGCSVHQPVQAPVARHAAISPAATDCCGPSWAS